MHHHALQVRAGRAAAVLLGRSGGESRSHCLSLVVSLSFSDRTAPFLPAALKEMLQPCLLHLHLISLVGRCPGGRGGRRRAHQRAGHAARRSGGQPAPGRSGRSVLDAGLAVRPGWPWLTAAIYMENATATVTLASPCGQSYFWGLAGAAGLQVTRTRNRIPTQTQNFPR